MKKSVFSVILALVVAISVAAPVHAEEMTFEDITANVTANYADILEGYTWKKQIVYRATELPVYTSADVNSPVFAVLPAQQTHLSPLESKDWLVLDLGSGMWGFVRRRDVKIVPMPAVIVDISSQVMAVYDENAMPIIVTNVVTGTAGTGRQSDIGYFRVNAKQTERILRGPGYASYVHYWMPYNKGEGIHDATWREKEEFNPTTYLENGSHGCINTPLEVMAAVYTLVPVGAPVIVQD